MNVRKLTLHKVTTHDHTEVDFPEHGIIAIVGENGSGKSTLVESVAYAGWGKTLRGSPLWRGEAKGDDAMTVTLITDELRIERGRKGAKTELEWEHFAGHACDAPGATSNDPEFETPTKANEALLSFVGSFDLWRRSHVFSSADATHFTLATDKERKQLIESFLGNTVFEPAIEACRADLRIAADKVRDLQAKKNVESMALELARKRLAETKRALADAKPPAPPPEKKAGKSMSELDALMKATRQAIADANARLRNADRAGAQWETEAANARNLLAKLRAATCPTCTQNIPDALRAKVKKTADDAAKKADDEKAAAKASVADVEGLIAELDEELETVQAARQRRANEAAAVASAKAEHDRYERLRAGLEATLRTADDDIARVTEALEAIEAELPAAVSEHAELVECERILGLKGVRATILGQSLAGIESLANAWLGRLNQGVEIKLSAYSETQKGNVNDSISLEVLGHATDFGGGHGYKGSSSGERRRLDVAILLALAEVAAAARGQEAGTLWFDEVFDHLDDKGKDFVAAALAELAETRTVVVITHSQTFLERLPIARLVRVAQGQLTVVQRGR